MRSVSPFGYLYLCVKNGQWAKVAILLGSDIND